MMLQHQVNHLQDSTAQHTNHSGVASEINMQMLSTV
jgi:hypothetical protein